MKNTNLFFLLFLLFISCGEDDKRIITCENYVLTQTITTHGFNTYQFIDSICYNLENQPLKIINTIKDTEYAFEYNTDHKLIGVLGGGVGDKVKFHYDGDDRLEYILWYDDSTCFVYDSKNNVIRTNSYGTATRQLRRYYEFQYSGDNGIQTKFYDTFHYPDFVLITTTNYQYDHSLRPYPSSIKTLNDYLQHKPTHVNNIVKEEQIDARTNKKTTILTSYKYNKYNIKNYPSQQVVNTSTTDSQHFINTSTTDFTYSCDPVKL